MIKMICTDCDDTILPEGRRDLNPAYFDMIRKFIAKGLKVVVASGRQKPSIKKTFIPVVDDIIYLADNGTDIAAPDYIDSLPFDEEDYQDLIRDLKSVGEEYHIMVCKADCSYIEYTSEAYYHRMVDSYGYVAEMVEDVAKISGICKISLFRFDGIEPHVADLLTKRWANRLDACLAGELFYDFMPKNCNKGKGLELLQKHYGILPEETVAFGNAPNDIPMLLQAGTSYAVKNASEDLKAVANEVIGSMKEDAVLKKMQEIYNAL
ncbi:MAG: Cof-type HAD-IIB family hydrolase [Lachnospiraceae bacterium]|nr:Cof-type HAD-IIB family hydrolase [Lachnospiraceae bacterium]